MTGMIDMAAAVSVAVLVFFSSLVVAGEKSIEVTIVHDNYENVDGLQTAWGFACIIEGLEKTILFATGLDGNILLSNMNKLGFEPANIACVILSHAHGDHTGGLDAFLGANPKCTVYMPKVFPQKLHQMVTDYGAELVLTEDSVEVCGCLHTTGVMGTQIPEQGIFIDCAEGEVVITGCAHPGIADMVRRAAELSARTPTMVIGGFHLRDHSDAAVAEIISAFQNMGVQQVCPTHCTGDNARKLFSEAYGKSYYPGGVGSRFNIELN